MNAKPRVRISEPYFLDKAVPFSSEFHGLETKGPKFLNKTESKRCFGGVLINASHPPIRNYNVHFWGPNLAVRLNKEISDALTPRFFTVRKIRRLQVT